MFSVFTFLPRETTQNVFGTLRVIKESTAVGKSVTMDMRADSNPDVTGSAKIRQSSSTGEVKTSDWPAIELASQQERLLPQITSFQQDTHRDEQTPTLSHWDKGYSSNAPMGYLLWANECTEWLAESDTKDYHYSPEPHPSEVDAQHRPIQTYECMHAYQRQHDPLP